MTVMLLQACASRPVSPLLTHWPAELPLRAEAADTPFIEQGDQECGPATLAMVMRHAGLQADVATLKPQVFLPGRQGSLQLEMPAAARRAGLAAYLLPPRLEALLQEVARGHPVIVFQNLGLEALPVWHYAVLMGYERQAQDLVLRLHSGPQADQKMGLELFERSWARGGHWAMVALPTDRLPASLAADEVAAALIRLERLHPSQAARGYRTALSSWPTHRLLLAGLGSTAHASGDLQAAEQAFARLVREHPDFPEGWHNLAQTRLDRGRVAAAHEAARRAVALGGAARERHLALLARIEARRSTVQSGRPRRP